MTSQENKIESNKEEYIPGVCNIGPDEIKRRRNSAILSVTILIAEIILLLLLNVGRIWRLTLLIPAASFAIGMLQWKFKFCVAFGMKGVFNFNETGNVTVVKEAENLKQDHSKSLKMILAGIVFGSLCAVIFYFI